MIWLADDPALDDLDGWRRRVVTLEELGDRTGDDGASLEMAREMVRTLEGNPSPRRPIDEILAKFR